MPKQEENGFAGYSLKNNNDAGKKEEEEQLNFGQFVERIESTYKDTKDQIYLEHYFKLMDRDGDGVLSHEDLTSHIPELGRPCMDETTFQLLAEKLNPETEKISKDEFIEIISPYI